MSYGFIRDKFMVNNMGIRVSYFDMNFQNCA